MSHIKKYSDWKTQSKVNENKIVPASYHFGGDLSTSSHIEYRAGVYSIWLNGGNAFRFTGLNKEFLETIYNSPELSKKLEESVMSLIVKAMDENIEKLIQNVIDSQGSTLVPVNKNDLNETLSKISESSNEYFTEVYNKKWDNLSQTQKNAVKKKAFPSAKDITVAWVLTSNFEEISQAGYGSAIASAIDSLNLDESTVDEKFLGQERQTYGSTSINKEISDILDKNKDKIENDVQVKSLWDQAAEKIKGILQEFQKTAEKSTKEEAPIETPEFAKNTQA